MYSITSEKFNNLISKSGRTFRARLFIDSKTMLEGFLSLKLNYCSNNGDALTIGSTISQYAEIEIEKPTISLEKKEFRLEIGLLLEDGTYEYVPMGMFTADKVQKKKFSVSFQAFDRMMKLSVGYVPTVVDSTNTIDVLNDISKQTGVPIKTTGLDPISMKKPVGMTCREVLMYISQMYASFAIVNRIGTIEIVFYKASGYTLTAELGINNLVKADSYTVERIVCATGQDAEGKTISISAGTGSNTISISNQFMTQTILNNVFASLNGFKYDAVDCPVILGDPRLDPCDIITVTDIEGVSYKVPLMNITYTYDGGLSCIIKSTVASTTETDNDFKGPMQQFEDRVLANIAVIKSLTADKATIKDLEALKIKVDNIVAGEVTVEYLKANYASIEYLKANYTSTQKLEAEYAKVKDLDVKYATIEKLTTEYLTAKQLEATYAKIQDLDVKYATIEKLNADYITAKQIEAKYATIEELHSEYITTDKIEAEYARLDKANIEDGWITNAMIGTGVIGNTQIADGSITDAKIVGLTANKITAGRLDAAQIEVVNLKAANITVGTINGQQISQGTIDFGNLNPQVSGTINSADKNATQALEDALNAMKEAQAAKEKAGSALTSANGKNKNYYQATAPTGGTYVVGDTWFNTAKDMQISHWNGTAWVVRQFGTSAIANAAITNALIADATITNAKIANLDAGKITSGYISADRIKAGSLVIGKLDSATQSTINGAKTNADKALLLNEVETIASDIKKFKNVCAFTSSGSTGYLIITTPITPARMVSMHIKGYNYVSGSETIDLDIGFYNYTDNSSPFHQYGFVNNGSFNVKEVKIARLSSTDSRVAVIIGTSDLSWSYPKIIVDEVIVAFNTTPDSYKDGFSATIATTLSSAYYKLTSLSGTNVKPFLNTLDGYIANWCYNNNKTYINGGKIYTGTVTANQLAANSVTAGKIAANAISAGNIVAGAITTDKLSANAVTSAKIAAGAITADKIVAGAITGAKIAASTITANNIAANAITAQKIAAGAITTDKLATKSITTDKLNVTSLSAISANLGSVTAATITNKRDGKNAIIMSSYDIAFYDWANDGQYAGKIAGSHHGGTSGPSSLNIVAPIYLDLNAQTILMNDRDILGEFDQLNSKLNDNRIGFPDYTKILATYSNTSFTAPQNCWARIESTSGWTNTTLSVNKNGIIIQQIKNTDNYPIKTTAMIPLKKGDLVTMSSKTSINGITAILYPMR